MRNIAKVSALSTGARMPDNHHLKTLLALTGSPALALGSLDEIAEEIASKSLESFDLDAAQVWQQVKGWQNLKDERSSKTDTAVYPPPGEPLPRDLAIRITDCPVMAPDDTPTVILRLIKPIGMQ